MSKTLKQKQEANGRTLALNGAAWRRLRALILEDEPLCRYCFVHCRVTPATDVDHINNDPSDNRRENLQALCHECHSRKTASDMGHNVRMGCDESGAPLNPNHPWNVAQNGQRSRHSDSYEPTGKCSVNANRKNEP
ncbi:HNH endonuclease signature motif containing protein [Noviherbaspirillum sp.]|uniref:HNH endonuclease n=1 Tax=Noviherbaspirillum sp. TaxID=1926288 RepID=UPI0025E4FFB4|nr:HNH endonuclease signature motif containing protein [Noviherbaspirillum sp.]